MCRSKNFYANASLAHPGSSVRKWGLSLEEYEQLMSVSDNYDSETQGTFRLLKVHPARLADNNSNARLTSLLTGNAS